MDFTADNKYVKVSFETGMNLLELGYISRLYSDGLDETEYIYYDKNMGFCYEDNCIIGEDKYAALNFLYSLGWYKDHNWYITKSINLLNILLELNVYVQYDLYTVNEEYVLQLFEKDQCPNDLDASYIWKKTNSDLFMLVTEALCWCREGE